jgi:peroxiredoxin
MKFKLFTLIALISSFCFSQKDIDTTTVLKVGAKLPQFKIQTLDGKTFNSEKLKGKIVLINFWATWCPPCRTELPLLQKEIFNKIKNKNFVVMAISRAEVKDTVKNFIRKNKYTFPVYLDPERKTYNLFAKNYIPRNFVIGKDGTIIWTSIGYEESDFNKMIEFINKELKK